MQSTLRRYLGIRDRRDDESARAEDEPFSCPPDCDRELLDRVVRERLEHWLDAGTGACVQAFESLYDGFARRGLMPSGHFRTLDRERQWTKAASALEALDGLLAGFSAEGTPDLKLDLRLGEGDRFAPPGEGPGFPPVRLTTPSGRMVELHGHLPNLFLLPGGAGCASLVVMRSSKRIGRFLSPFLFHLAGLQSESALGKWLQAGKFSLKAIHSAEDRFSTWSWAPFDISPGTARAYLGSLLDDFLAGPDYDLLPFDAIAKCLVEGPQLYRLKADPDYAGLLREEIEEGEGKEWASWRPGETVRLLAPEIPADAFRKVQARLGPFFNWT